MPFISDSMRISQLLGDYQPTKNAYAEAISGSLGVIPLITELAIANENEPFFHGALASDTPHLLRPGLLIYRLDHPATLQEAMDQGVKLQAPEIFNTSGAADGEWTVCIEYSDLSGGVHALFESSRSRRALQSLLAPLTGESSITVEESNGRTLLVLDGPLTRGMVACLDQKYDEAVFRDAKLPVEAGARIASLIAHDLDERHLNAFGEYPELSTEEGLRRLGTVADIQKEAMIMQVKPHSDPRFPGFQGITHYDIGLALFRHFTARDGEFAKLAAAGDQEDILDVFVGRIFYRAPLREHEYRLEVLKRLQEKHDSSLLEKMAARVFELAEIVYAACVAHSRDGIDPCLSDSFNNPTRDLCDLFRGGFLHGKPSVIPSAFACLAAHLEHPVSDSPYFI